MRTRRARSVVLLFAVLWIAVATATTPSVAHDHAAPQAELLAGSAVQPGRSIHGCWTTREQDGGYVTGCWVGPWRFASPIDARFRHPVRIRIYKTAPPETATLSAWAIVDKDQVPVGPGVRLTTTPKQGDGWWDLVFTFDVPCRHYYLQLQAVWTDEEGSDNKQGVRWTFHARSVPGLADRTGLIADSCVIPGV